ncbi:nicotinamidase isoform X1 [Megalopta genalis]|uniref:nicotinamidase isoform X1 n=1 Tax=Megalopta genalis TaxID=115081 RepID=UPI003FD610CA
MQRNNNELDVDLFGVKGHRSVKKFLASLDLPNLENTLNYDNFRLICNALFPPNEIKQNDDRIRNIFDLFDDDHDGILKGQEWKIRLLQVTCTPNFPKLQLFIKCRFHEWLQMTIEPVNVLLIVDVQNDFIDGTLALRDFESNQNGFDVVGPINRLTKYGLFDKVIYSMDCHPENHISFHENLHLREIHPESKVSKENAKVFDSVTFAKACMEQILWPKHCVMNTWGAQLHKDLVIVPGSEQVKKGTHPEKDAYSVFAATDSAGVSKLEQMLRELGTTQLFVCGLAYDVCLKETCLDGLRLGYPVAVIDDCCRGVNLKNIDAAKHLIIDNGGLIAITDKILSLVNTEERSLIMSHRSAKKIASISEA